MSIVGSVTVRVVPSFTGVHKQIAQQVVGTASKAGSDAGASMSRAMSASLNLQAVGSQVQNVGRQVSSLGSTLTRNLTMPIAGATLAAGGLVAAFGWGRLRSVDAAQAQLRGLGYETADVERISGQLSDALEGGMLTMGEATSAAAAGMAAGVEEGEELTRYIQLLDAATAGSNGTFDEMNQIFARIQGSGRLMTNELDMIEQRMPGFSGAAADHFGVSQEALREMVSAGEVSADDFLDIMDGFAGDMATEYAKSWDGMVQNTKAYIGILGENLLGGVFEQSKEAIAEFIEFLASDDVAEWAQSTGEAIGAAFSDMLDSVRDAISWWMDLDTETKKLFGTLAGAAVAAGPFLLILGKMITFFGGIISGIGSVVGWFSRLLSPLLASTSSMTLLGRALVIGGQAFRFLTGPIGWVITALIGVWNASEDFRESVINLGVVLWDSLVSAFEMVWGHVQNLLGSFGELWDSLSQGGGFFDILGTALSWVVDLFAWLLPIVIEFGAYLISGLVVALDWVVQAITAVVNWMTGLGDETTTQGGVITAIWEWIKGAVSATASWMVNTAWPMIQSVWDGIVTGAQWMWSILEPIFIFIAAVFLWLGQTLWNIWVNHIKRMFDTFATIARWLWNNVLQPVFRFIAAGWDVLSTALMWAYRNVIKPMFDAFMATARWLWSNVLQPVIGWIVDRWNWMKDLLVYAWRVHIQPMLQRFGEWAMRMWRNYIKPALDSIVDRWNWLRDRMLVAWRDYIQPMLLRFGQWVRRLYRNYIRPALGWIVDRWNWLKDTLTDIWENKIRPVLRAFADFVRYDVVDRIERGIDMIDDAWRKVANIFRRPINWVINTVWNDGIKGAFDSVARAVGNDTRLPSIPRIPAFAKGGRADRGWALVGEEGPELVNFSNPGRVYTADDTRDMLGGTDAPMTPEELAAAKGQQSASGFGIGNWLSKGASWLAENTPVGDVVDWARGGLADAAETFLKPILDRVSSFVSEWGYMGQLGSGLIDWGVDELMDWIRGEDSVPDVYDGEFTANPGGFNRPAGGPITSMAGPRSYVGRFGNMHYGVDIGVPIGSAIRAAFDGVIKARRGGGLDQMVVVNHGGFDTAYLHNSAITKSVGTRVTGGDIIARSGTAGSGPHLHFELHPGGWYNPSVGRVNSLFRDKGGLIYPGMNQVLNNTGRPEYTFEENQFRNVVRMAEQGGNGGGTVHFHQHGIEYQHADKNAQAFMFAQRRESRKVGVR